jgi:hypothetical protein
MRIAWMGSLVRVVLWLNMVVTEFGLRLLLLAIKWPLLQKMGPGKK